MKLSFTLMLALAVAAPAAADDCRHTAPRQLTASVDGIRLVEVKGAAGSLVVRGAAGGGVRAFGTACSSSSDDLAGIRLESRRSGDRLIVEAVMPNSDSWSFGWNVQRRLDFTVEMPANLPAAIHDGSGPMEVLNLAAAEIEDGSGEIEVRGVRGLVKIADGSGDISVAESGGPVRITDGSGSIDVRGIRSEVVIEEDGSGEIEVAKVGGNVTVEDDGSGGIEIADITGNVLIDDDGSGSIQVRTVSGDFTVRHDGSGGVSSDGVRGRVSVPKRR